jgi:hypothetical protein
VPVPRLISGIIQRIQERSELRQRTYSQRIGRPTGHTGMKVTAVVFWLPLWLVRRRGHNSNLRRGHVHAVHAVHRAPRKQWTGQVSISRGGAQ